MEYALLALAGLVLGALGTLVGAGGGFLLVPLLLFLYPKEEPESITAISLTVVMFNALSGSLAYWRQRRIDVRSALWFSVAAVPGAVGGVLLGAVIPIWGFQLILGAALVAVSIVLFFRGGDEGERDVHRLHQGGQAPGTPDRWGPAIAHRRWVGLALAFGVGFLSSLLGIGGGIIHVPVLVHALGFPVHVATATSHLVLAITSGAGVATHILIGAFHTGVRRAAAISVGVVIGAQIGAAYSPRFSGRLILRGLGVALLVAGLRVLYLGASA